VGAAASRVQPRAARTRAAPLGHGGYLCINEKAWAGGGEKKINQKPRTYTGPGLKKHPPTFFSFFFFFFKKFLVRFWVFLGMGGSKTAKKLFWKFFGHDPKSHLMTQKNIFFRYLLCTFPAILRPLKPP
jgi:hypothetical protein